MIGATLPIDDRVEAGDILSIRGLRKSFPGVVALAGVDFDVRKGEVHALLGANGAGKSTLIKIVAGLYQRDSGSILLNGSPVAFGDTAAAMRAGISVIYQDFALVPHLSVADNIFLGSETTKTSGVLDRRAMHAQARRLLDLVGASFPVTVLVSELGSGQRQMVEIAKALRGNARILILDEPTASLSHAESERLFGLIRKLATDGVGIVYVSHRLEEIAPLVQRVTVLRDGVSAGTFPIAHIDRSKIIQLITGHERGAAKRDRHVSGERVSTEGGPALETSRLTRSGEFQDITLTLRKGEVVVLTGLVGSGRTELLETLFGLRQAERGEIRIDGRVFPPKTPMQAIAAGLALIPEDRRGQGMSVVMPVYENMALPILSRFVARFGLSIRRQIAHAETLIGRLAIRPPDPRAVAGALSGGNQQKVVLAKWLSTNATIFLFDEPTQGVDVGAKDEIYGLIDQLAAQGRAVLVVSSDLEEVLAIGDRVLAMRAGRIVAEFQAEAISASRIVEAVTLGHQQ
ncbi:sugar ABC transporter ATP-binding protein [Mesorhizobium sp. WSM4976]|jgi:ABC-type sugar transport system ATPase subunit|uniref:sugar ABC transporter ATP-binding protein n=1 Tax=Mesorhizobium sp. WSM4976 TaxID=3038549 RepID=UPI002415E9AD|nr:sugar ABC transporter ATP-binding protein [Mesorhizobium sp. WSM4976]MDG4892448.1 sugar ABC transporter ATP-binding protein [Mesorhizobium sp. WSM4976]